MATLLLFLREVWGLMARMFVACRRIMDDGECTVEISAESAEELLEAVIEHAYACHAEEDTPALREQIRNNFAACRPQLRFNVSS